MRWCTGAYDILFPRAASQPAKGCLWSARRKRKAAWLLHIGSGTSSSGTGGSTRICHRGDEGRRRGRGAVADRRHAPSTIYSPGKMPVAVHVCAPLVLPDPNPYSTLQSCLPVTGSGGKQPFGLRFARWPALRKTVLDLASSASAAEATATTLRRRRSSCPRGAEGRPLSCLGSACGEILPKQARVLSQPNVLHARLVEIGDRATVPDDRAPIADHADVSVTAAFPSRRFRQIGDRGPVLSTRRPSLDICHRAWQQSASSRGALEAS